MSTTYIILCKDCRKSYCAGQSDYLYDEKKMFNFLYLHQKHHIIFVNDYIFDCCDEWGNVGLDPHIIKQKAEIRDWRTFKDCETELEEDMKIK